MKNPCESTSVINLVEACRRKLGKPKTKKEPISPEHLASLVKDFGHRKASLKDIRLLAICLLGNAGFFRHSELRNIRRSDIIFYRTYVKVFIEKGKTDSYREGKWVLIARTGKLTCPVCMIKRYLAKANIRADEDNFIFRSLNYFRFCRQYKLKRTMKPLSYVYTAEQGKSFLKDLRKSVLIRSSLVCTVYKQEGGPLQPKTVYPTDYSNVTDVGVRKTLRMVT